MTMASLTASLLTRTSPHEQGRRGMHAPADKAGHATGLTTNGLASGGRPARVPVPATGPGASRPPRDMPAKQYQARTGTSAPSTAGPQPRPIQRKSKTLRLDPGTDLRLRLTAARLGITQQSIMEQGLKTLLDKTSPDGRCLCGLAEKNKGAG